MKVQSYTEALHEIERIISRKVRDYLIKKVTGYVIAYVENGTLTVKILNDNVTFIKEIPDVVDMVFHGVTTFEISSSLLKIYQSEINKKFFKNR